jgi:hypothetical protein
MRTSAADSFLYYFKPFDVLFLHLLQWKIADCHWTLSLGGRAIVIGDTKYTGARSYSQVPTVIGWTQY